MAYGSTTAGAEALTDASTESTATTDASTDGDAEATTPTLTASEVSKILKKKLRKAGGTQVSIVLLRPTPSKGEELNGYESVSIGIEKALGRNDGLTLRRTDSSLEKLNLDHLKRAVAKAHADVLLAPSFKADRWSLILYDRKSPFEVVMHSETVPESFIRKPTEVAKANITRELVSQLFYKYAKGETFDLPQDEAKPILQTEVPRWMATASLMWTINSEFTKRFYFSASIGGVVASGYEGRGTSSGMLGLQLGIRPLKVQLPRLVAEISGQFFTYNAILVSLKYYFLSKAESARLYIGLGAASLSARKTLAVDRGGSGLGSNSKYAVPSVAMVVPIGDLLFKIEAQYFRSIDDRSNSIFAFMPGLFIPF